MSYDMWELRRRGGDSLSKTSTPGSNNDHNGTTSSSTTTALSSGRHVDVIRDDHLTHHSSASERKRLSHHLQRGHHNLSSYGSRRPRSNYVLRGFLAVLLALPCGICWWLLHRQGSLSSFSSDHYSDPRLAASSLPRTAKFIYQDGSDVEREKALDKISKFQELLNITSSLGNYDMASPKFLRSLNNSKDYRLLGEPLHTEDCEPQYEWQKTVYPTCNTLHEFGDLTALEGESHHNVVTKIIANGYWRDVWIVQDESGVRVVKTLRYQHKLTLRNYDRNRRDAVALEHLTASKYVVGIYGYCSAAGLFEYSNGGDVSNAIWPEDGSKGLSPIRKLQIATQGAMALASVHNWDKEGQATIAHTDIGPDQFILIDGRYKLNDFNRCRFLLKFKGNGTNCPYFVGKNPGKNRSPEEYRYDPQTEKVDVYSYGNIIYSLLQEEVPFVDVKAKKVPDLVMDGGRPSIYYDVWNSTDPIIQALRDAMIMCHEHEPEDRASAREVEVFLKTKLEEFDPGRLHEWGDA